MPSPVTLAIIVRDDPGLEHCLKSVRPHVSKIVVVDTGSVDDTPEVARRYADKVDIFTACNDPATGLIESFSMARNHSYKLAAQMGEPWTMWLDSDDELVHGERLSYLIDQADQARKGAPAYVVMPYQYASDAQGRPTTWQYRERLHCPADAFEWQQPVHEVLCPKPNIIPYRIDTDDVQVFHRRHLIGKQTESGRNLRILRKLHAAEGDRDARTLYYLGQELGNHGLYQESVDTMTRYVGLSGWDDEKCLAILRIVEYVGTFIVDPVLKRPNFDLAVEWAWRAVAVKDNWGECWWALARVHYNMACAGIDPRTNYERCVRYAQRGLACPPTETLLFVNPRERVFDVHQFLNLALNYLGDVKGALESVETGLKHEPQDGNFLHNRVIYEDFLARHDVKVALDKLIQIGRMGTGRRDRIVAVLDEPDTIQDGASIVFDNVSTKMVRGEQIIAIDQKLVDVTEPTATPFVPIKPTGAVPAELKRVAIYVGPSVEAWSPTTAKKSGIGGSETAVIEMARRLVQAGHNVTVYGDVSRPGLDLSGMYEGVAYVDHGEIRGTETDILIVSRRADLVDPEWKIRRKLTYCWVHDIHVGDSLTRERRVGFDRFLCLTDWHRRFFLSTYPFLPAEQVGVTQNGIDLARFDVQVDRNPHRAVYSSSPDRGLEVLLRCWPRIRAVVPDAELHVFYGFKNWEFFAQRDPRQLQVIGVVKQLLADLADQGVTMHDRVDQATLATEYAKSGVWAYPTWFTETSCLVGETKVLVSDDEKGLREERIDDLAKMFNPILLRDRMLVVNTFAHDALDTKDFVSARIARVWKTREADQTVSIHTSQGRTLQVTDEHQILLANGLWMRADQIQIGDFLLGFREGASVTDITVHRHDVPVPVYDVEIEAPGPHNFVAEGVVVHNCISAMEAQAAGLRIVTSSIAALNETVGDRGVRLDGDWLSADYQDRFVKAVVVAMQKAGDEDRVAVASYAREHFNWDVVADQWRAMFELDWAATPSLPPYRPVMVRTDQ